MVVFQQNTTKKAIPKIRAYTTNKRNLCYKTIKFINYTMLYSICQEYRGKGGVTTRWQKNEQNIPSKKVNIHTLGGNNYCLSITHTKNHCLKAGYNITFNNKKQ